MKREIAAVLLGFCLALSACGAGPKTQTPAQEPEVQEVPQEEAPETEEGEEETMEYDFSQFTNVEITGIDLSSLGEEELSVLYAQARYCQAMTDADTDTMRELVSEEMTFTHMSGMQQTREEYFADVADGSLRYFTIGIADPEIRVGSDEAQITYTAVLNANAYGARGTFRMKGTHHYEKRDGAWIAVNG